MKLLISLCSILAVSQALGIYEFLEEKWELFKLLHKKQYSETEEWFRFKIFAENKHKIEKHNANLVQGKEKYELGMNEYGDLLHHEFIETMNGFRYPPQKLENRSAMFVSPENVQLPENVDWREDGAVTPVKNQRQCGSCWSFSAIGALEGQHFLKTGVLVSLSEQNLIDCSKEYGTDGCNGGCISRAFEYIKNNGGIDTEVSYPYEARDGECRYNAKNSGTTNVGYMNIPYGSERHLKEAVATVGPISVAIDASHNSFRFYKQGVYFEEKCSKSELDHAVLVVGYGIDEETQEEYWLIKNSWGPSWGDNGYGKMARNRGNNCGIATSASYPLLI